MVYGEFVQKPSVELCELLSTLLPNKLNTTYLTNSGTEAIEAALKLAKRSTGRQKIISMKNSYHGSTHGSLSVSGFETRKRRYRPLLPNVHHINFNSVEDLNIIDNSVACVIVEPIQGGAGFIESKKEYLKKLRVKCNEMGVILIFDELQSGIGRTGKMFAFEHYNITPDILVIGKALGGGFPIGAIICNQLLMNKFQSNPILGHITTFGGHPVIARAGHETLKYIIKNDLVSKSSKKEKLFRSLLKHKLIYEIRGKGLMLALIMKNNKIANYLVKDCLNNGLILFFLLTYFNYFNPRRLYSSNMSPTSSSSSSLSDSSSSTFRNVISIVPFVTERIVFVISVSSISETSILLILQNSSPISNLGSLS